jgi:hypothetical protein
MPKNIKAFHVVKHSYNDKFITYSIFKDNEPYLVTADDMKLGKVKAYLICKVLNS